MISPRGVIFCPIFCSGVISTSAFKNILLFNKGIDRSQIPLPSSISSHGDNFDLVRFYGGEGFEKQRIFRNGFVYFCCSSRWVGESGIAKPENFRDDCVLFSLAAVSQSMV